jgi:hypothetical protein
MVERMPVVQIPLRATILIPDRGPELDEFENFSYLGSCALMFCMIQQLPGDRSTIATCTAYTATYGNRPVSEGTLLRFPTPDYFLVARVYLLDDTRAAGGDPQIGDKRPLEGGHPLNHICKLVRFFRPVWKRPSCCC